MTRTSLALAFTAALGLLTLGFSTAKAGDGIRYRQDRPQNRTSENAYRGRSGGGNYRKFQPPHRSAGRSYPQARYDRRFTRHEPNRYDRHPSRRVPYFAHPRRYAPSPYRYYPPVYRRWHPGVYYGDRRGYPFPGGFAFSGSWWIPGLAFSFSTGGW